MKYIPINKKIAINYENYLFYIIELNMYAELIMTSDQNHYYDLNRSHHAEVEEYIKNDIISIQSLQYPDKRFDNKAQVKKHIMSRLRSNKIQKILKR